MLKADGLRRKDDIDWCGKLSLYEKLNLKYIIIKPVQYHFMDNKDKCFEELDRVLGEQLKLLPKIDINQITKVASQTI